MVLLRVLADLLHTPCRQAVDVLRRDQQVRHQWYFRDGQTTASMQREGAVRRIRVCALGKVIMAEVVTFEDAKKCPRCGTPGEERQTEALSRGHGHMHWIYCVKELCPWFDTCWMVQTLEDGTIPVREHDPSQPTDLSRFKPTPAMNEAGRRYMENVLGRELTGEDIQ